MSPTELFQEVINFDRLVWLSYQSLSLQNLFIQHRVSVSGMRVLVFVYTRTCVPVGKDQRLAVGDFLILLHLIYLSIYISIYYCLFIYSLYQFSDAFKPAHCKELLFLLPY